MPDSAPSKQPPTLFISYAHESDALRTSVAALAQWLVGHGCRVFTDHPYIDRPPPEGWLAWMLGCIEQADTVLVVCTPRLKGRYEKTAAPDAGRGATYEGAIVTQRIYDDVMRNTKFFPILPDGGSEDHIPTTLKPWWNGTGFPVATRGSAGWSSPNPPASVRLGRRRPAGAETGASPWSIGPWHGRLAARLLSAVDASLYFQALQEEMAGEWRIYGDAGFANRCRDGATLRGMPRRAGTTALLCRAACLASRPLAWLRRFRETPGRGGRGRAVLSGGVAAGGSSASCGARDARAQWRTSRLRHHRDRAMRRRAAPGGR